MILRICASNLHNTYKRMTGFHPALKRGRIMQVFRVVYTDLPSIAFVPPGKRKWVEGGKILEQMPATTGAVDTIVHRAIQRFKRKTEISFSEAQPHQILTRHAGFLYF
ncbi:hypothetical protein RR51_18580 [Pseudomonas sp. C5pp]|nr:hypothetical protein RR51_18580 [Pseudomonas sp. C5pp]